MTNAYLVEWIRKAEEDYYAALALARQRKKSTPNAVCFHCQQCAEKYLKAFLVINGVVFPKTHDLLELHKLGLSVEPALEFIGDLLDSLNPYAVEFRYPGEEVNSDEAKAALRTMKEVRRFIRSQLGEIVNEID
jgi:HEPN domain-containing protein